jgi:hypothetical protein
MEESRMKDELIYCYDCGCEIEEGSEYQDPYGNSICEDCFDETYIYCEYCGDVIPQDDAIGINNGEFYVCESCADHNYYRCDYCDNYFSDRHIYTRNINICVDCIEHVYSCDGCSDFIYEYDAHFFDDGVYCDSCALEYARNNLIHDAYYRPDPWFLGGRAAGYYGIELEIDGGYDRGECAAAIMEAAPDDSIYLKYDGSLRNGFEIVTHPATLDYHINNMRWEEICNAAIDYGFRSHDTNTCGLHIHASRTLFGQYEMIQDLNIAKCILLIENNFNSIILPFSRRTSDLMREWARRPCAGINEYDSELTAINKAKMTEDDGRYQAVNLMNRNTVEFRFNRGTLNVNTIIASIQFIDFIIKYVNANNLKDVCIKDFRDVLQQQATGYLKDYLIRRNIIKNNESEGCKECV